MMSSAVPLRGSSPTRAYRSGFHANGNWYPLHQDVHVDGDREVVDHGVRLGERHVVDHRHVLDRDRELLGDPTVTADDGVVDVVDQIGPVVGHRVELAGGWVVLRVRGERSVERAAEARSARADRVRSPARRAGCPLRPSPTSCRRIRRRWCSVRKSRRPGRPRMPRTGCGTTRRCPPRSRTPWTMPCPMNQWCFDGSAVVSGLGPLRSQRPSSSVGDLTDDREVERGDLLGRRGRSCPARYRFALGPADGKRVVRRGCGCGCRVGSVGHRDLLEGGGE